MTRPLDRNTRKALAERIAVARFPDCGHCQRLLTWIAPNREVRCRKGHLVVRRVPSRQLS
jgi:hypothetical protein